VFPRAPGNVGVAKIAMQMQEGGGSSQGREEKRHEGRSQRLEEEGLMRIKPPSLGEERKRLTKKRTRGRSEGRIIVSSIRTAFWDEASGNRHWEGILRGKKRSLSLGENELERLFRWLVITCLHTGGCRTQIRKGARDHGKVRPGKKQR